MTAVGEWVERLREHRWGLLVDLVFALLWVTMVELLVGLLNGPSWAYYLLVLTGIVAYFVFFETLDSAVEDE